jgi:hypothetical protein
MLFVPALTLAINGQRSYRKQDADACFSEQGVVNHLEGVRKSV